MTSNLLNTSRMETGSGWSMLGMFSNDFIILTLYTLTLVGIIYSPYGSLYISYGTDKENLDTNK